MPSDPFPEHTPAEVPPRYPPIGDYGLIGDCRTAALVSRWGSVDWLCLPHFSGEPVFAALLDRDRGGAFWIRPAGRFSVTRRYFDETNVLQTRFEAGTGVLEVTDCMPVCTGPSAYLEPQRELLRRIDCLEGDVELEVHYAPRFELDRRRRPLRRRGALGWACQHGSEQLFLYGDLDLQPDGDHAVGTRLRLRAGERRWLSLTYVQRDLAVIAPLGDAAEQRLQATIEWWRNWSGRCRYEGPYREEVHRSLLALKLLTFHLSGAVIAAPTASLPEWIGGVRNWDYRYCWLRDAALIFEAFAGVGHVTEAHAFLDWLLHATRLTWPELQVMYDVYGETRLTEQELDLEGYRGSRPVRIGNAAHSQVQLDTYGAVISAAAAFLDGGGRLDAWTPRRPRCSSVSGAESAATGGSRTRASGRSAARAATMSTSSSCAGSAWTAWYGFTSGGCCRPSCRGRTSCASATQSPRRSKRGASMKRSAPTPVPSASPIPMPACC